MKNHPNPKGPWIHRFTIRLFTLIFTVLVYWALGFLVQDIQSIKGPDYSEIEKEYVDQDLTGRIKELNSGIEDLDRSISSKQEEMRLVDDSSENLQKTIGQLIELQKLSIEKSVALSESDQQNLNESLNQFLESQQNYQSHSEELTQLAQQKRTLQDEKIQLEKTVADQREPARKEFERLKEKHDWKLAALQLAILIPLLAVAAFLVIRRRESVYFPLYLGFGIATLLKVTLVIHRYFPTRYFKYILVAVLLLAVARVLIHFIRMVAFPKAQWLTRQYREAYERFLCPVCEYPIRTGPRKFLFWTRRTVNKIVIPREAGQEEEPYSCPSCGTVLLEECPECHNIRHALLPHCSHCNAEKEITGSGTESSAG